MKRVIFIVLTVSTSIMVWLSNHSGALVMALPPTEEIPEEILRLEIITTARSPVDGKVLTAAEYAELQVKIKTRPIPELDSKIREQVFLLRLRKALLQIFPFLDI